MPKKNMPSAKMFHFYSKFWTEEVDSMLIAKLVALDSSGMSFPKEPSRRVLDDILEDVSSNCNRTFPRSKFLMQFNKLRVRYDTFELILMNDGVTWDKRDNFVIVKESMRDTVCKLFPIADSYRQEGEREWDALSKIFGVKNDQPPRNEPEVIIISSDDEFDSIAITNAIADDSVVSPYNSKRGEKKHFDVGTSVVDGFNDWNKTMDIGTSYNTNEHLETKNNFDLNITPADSGDQLSSTTSCSPFKFPKA